MTPMQKAVKDRPDLALQLARATEQLTPVEDALLEVVLRQAHEISQLRDRIAKMEKP